MLVFLRFEHFIFHRRPRSFAGASVQAIKRTFTHARLHASMHLCLFNIKIILVGSDWIPHFDSKLIIENNIFTSGIYLFYDYE